MWELGMSCALEKTIMATACEILLESCLQPLKTLYLHYYNTYGHQTWQGGDFLWEAVTHKVRWTFDHKVVLEHATI